MDLFHVVLLVANLQGQPVTLMASQQVYYKKAECETKAQEEMERINKELVAKNASIQVSAASCLDEDELKRVKPIEQESKSDAEKQASEEEQSRKKNGLRCFDDLTAGWSDMECTLEISYGAASHEAPEFGIQASITWKF